MLPLRGKILNVASASTTKLADNQLIGDLVQALGCGTDTRYREEDLRYEKVVIMTDADVDGAHIASLLITFFYREMRGLIDGGHLYLAVPPLYRLSQGGKTAYARDDAHKDALLKSDFNGRGKVEISRFKGLGEMLPRQLKETTMDRSVRTLLRVEIAEEDRSATTKVVDQLMGNKAGGALQIHPGAGRLRQARRVGYLSLKLTLDNRQLTLYILSMAIRNFRHKALKRLFERDDPHRVCRPALFPSFATCSQRLMRQSLQRK